MKKIAIVCLANIGNAGDNILGEVTDFLISKNNNIVIKHVELQPNNQQLLQSGKIFSLVLSYLYRAVTLKVLKKRGYAQEDKKFRLRLKNYYISSFKDCDGIVFAIGMLKYSTQRFSYCFNLITEIADELKIPILMNAMSIAEINLNDWRCQQLIRAINRDCIKFITTRDGSIGLNRLRGSYIHNSSIETDYVGDPALWIPECYNINKKDSNILGIGLVRQNIFQAYGKKVSSNELLDFYCDLISELEQTGQKWELFCNGMPEDYAFGNKIVQVLNLPEDKLRNAPLSSKELIELISNYKVILGGRLHACITAVSLDIPVVGMIWDDKFEMFADTMKITNDFISEDKLDGKFAAYKLLDLMENGQRIDVKEEYKERTQNYIHRFINL